MKTLSRQRLDEHIRLAKLHLEISLTHMLDAEAHWHRQYADVPMDSFSLLVTIDPIREAIAALAEHKPEDTP